MLKKLMSNDRISAYNLLKKLSVSVQDVRFHTEYNNLFVLLKKHNENAPEPRDLIKVMKKKTVIEVGYLLKKAVVAHYFIQHESSISNDDFTGLLDFLVKQCDQWSNSVNKEENSKIVLTQVSFKNKNLNLTEVDSVEKRVNGKQKFILTEIIRPYIFYIKKFWMFGNEMAKQQVSQSCKVWGAINMLNLINGFANNFVAVGRYFIQDYGSLIIFLTEALAFDISKHYKVIRHYVKSQYKQICVKSSNRQQRREAQQFSRLIEEVGIINEKLTQIYMSKYFYQFLEHLQQPEWIDTNSGEFDRIFKGSDKENSGDQSNVKRRKKGVKN